MRSKQTTNICKSRDYESAFAAIRLGAAVSTIFGGGFTRQILRFLFDFLLSKYLILIYILANPFRNMVIRW